MEYEFKVDHMCCGHCETSITDAVDDLEGVSSVTADSETNTVSVTGSEGTEQRVREVIENTGFDVSA